MKKQKLVSNISVLDKAEKIIKVNRLINAIQNPQDIKGNNEE